MKVIYKYKLRTLNRDDIVLELPDDGDILSIQLQDNELTAWALVDPKSPITTMTFKIFMTGETFDHDAILDQDFYYVTTVQRLDGIVCHVFGRRDR